MQEGTLMLNVSSYWQALDNCILVRKHHQLFNEDLTFTFLRSLPSSFHMFVVSLNTHTDQLFMELVCGKLL
jgi:hypothetical protein